MRNTFKFSSIEVGKETYIQTMSAQAYKLCEQEEIGQVRGGKYFITVDEYKYLQEKYGEAIKYISHNNYSDSEYFDLSKEEFTKQWVVSFLDEKGEMIKPVITGNTKFEALLNALHKALSMLEKANEKSPEHK